MDSMKAMQYHYGEKSNISNKSIVPEFVSIGPRFRGIGRDLLRMEEIKWQCMSSLLNRLQGNAEGKLAYCEERILRLEEEVRASYVDDPKGMKWRDMANIMLYDGCFVLELLNRGLSGMFLESSLSLEECKMVLSDLLVLDNQIPFFILRMLYCQLFDKVEAPIETLALNLYYGSDIPDRGGLSAKTQNASNFVELVHSYISEDLKGGQGSNQHNLEIRGGVTHVQLDRCATMLRAAGVKIELLDAEIVLQGGFDFRVTFNCIDGTLIIPALYIIETTKARWQNLIAWEHHKMEASGRNETFICTCTSAALFFNALICCESDVQLLKDKGIIVDYPHKSNKDLLTFFRSIIHGITNQDKIDPRCSILPLDDLNKYHRSPIKYCIQIPLKFWHSLTGSPREAVRDLHSFLKKGYNFAVALIGILSLLQTIYSVLSYYQSKK